MEAVFLAIVHLMELLLHAFFYLLFQAFNWMMEGAKHPSPSAVLARLGIVAFVLIFFTTLCGAFQWWHTDHVARISATEQLVDRLAEAYYQESKSNDAQFRDGPLAERDAWDQPLWLDTEKSLLGWWIVVRSNGADGRPDTADDVTAIRQNWSNLEQVGGELAQRGTDKVKEKIQGLFAGKPDEDQEKQPDDQDAQPLDAGAEEEKKGFKLPSIKFSWGESDEKPADK